MLELLPKWHLHGNRPSFYDTDSVTLLELAAKLHGAMNELISDYNRFVDGVNTKITEFNEGANNDREVFETALRQEFQDFINVVDLKISSLELLPGPTGPQGEPGKTPVKGIDYFTPEEKAEFVSDVIAALPDAEEVVV